MAIELTKEAAKNYRAHVLMKMLGCDLKTARKIKAGELFASEVESSRPVKDKIKKQEK